MWIVIRSPILQKIYSKILGGDIQNFGWRDVDAWVNDNNGVQFRDTLVFNMSMGVVQFIWG